MRTHTSETRRLRIKEILKRLDAGVDVQARDLKIVLGKEKYSEFQRRWNEQKERRCIEKPPDVVMYEGLLKKALLCYSKYDEFSGKHFVSNRIIINWKERMDKLKNSADSAFERALEFLQEAFERDPSICVWFDRNVSFDIDTHISLDPIGMPRVITSRSLDNLSSKVGRFGIVSKRELKKEFLQEVLSESEKTESEKSAEQEKIKALIAKLKPIDY